MVNSEPKQVQQEEAVEKTTLNHDEWARCIYEKAYETFQHADVVFYEVAAIIWSANTLLLGFILEVPLTPGRQRLVAWTAVLGVVLSAYVPLLLRLTKIGQKTALTVLWDIEKNLSSSLQLHTKIRAVYPKKRAQVAAWVITVMFVILWLYIFQRAAFIVYCSNRS